MQKPRKPYSKPRVAKGRMRNVSWRPGFESSTYKIVPWFAAKPKVHYVRIYRSGEERAIMEMLHKAGLGVESAGKASDRKIVVSRHIGENLQNYSRMHRKEKVKRVLYNLFGLVGRMHALGVEHGHLHSENIVVKNGRPFLIDFKLSRRVAPGWKNPRNVYFKFANDHIFLGKLFIEMIFSTRAVLGEDASKLLKRNFLHLVAQYPCSKRVKEEIVSLIMENQKKNKKFQ